MTGKDWVGRGREDKEGMREGQRTEEVNGAGENKEDRVGEKRKKGMKPCREEEGGRRQKGRRKMSGTRMNEREELLVSMKNVEEKETCHIKRGKGERN